MEYCRKVWPEAEAVPGQKKQEVAILLCLWHTRKAWLENATQKIKANYLRAEILAACADLMYGNGILQGDLAVQAARERFQFIKAKYPQAKAFFVYFETTWIPKIEMWVKGFRNMPHANQDTNAAVESYHANLKALLRMSRSKFDGRRVDWLIYHLLKDVLIHYWYAVQLKLYGFIKNGKAEGIVASAVIRAEEIPDELVKICEEQDIAYVASQTNFPAIWVVTSPNSDWAHCNCPLGMRGNICKHVVKVFRMINADAHPGDIIRYAGTLRGTIQVGFKPAGITEIADVGVVEEIQDRRKQPAREDDPEKSLREIDAVLALLRTDALENPALREIFLAMLNESKGKFASLKVKAAAGLLHPLSQPSFKKTDGPKNLRRFKACSETGAKKRGGQSTKWN